MPIEEVAGGVENALYVAATEVAPLDYCVDGFEDVGGVESERSCDEDRDGVVFCIGSAEVYDGAVVCYSESAGV